jgi:hypothetical protein
MFERRLAVTIAVCALVIAGCSGAAPTPQIIYLTPAPAAVPSIIYVTAAPSLAPTPTDTPSPTLPDVSLFETGLISFGTHYNAALLIDKGTSRFSRSYSNICWSASLSQPAGATSLTFIYARVDTGGAETSVYRTTVDVSDPSDDLLANCADLATLASNRAGTYVLRYARDATVLAAGRFTLH